MKHLKYLSWLLTLLLITVVWACSNDDEPGASNGGVAPRGIAPLELQAELTYTPEYGEEEMPIPTRATAANTWNQSNNIAVYASSTSYTGSAKNYQTASSAQTSSITGKDLANTHHWISKTETKAVKAWFFGDNTYRESSATDWTVPAVQTSTTIQDKDFLYASANVSYNTAATLNFYHQMAKVTITVKFLNSGITTVSSVKLGNKNIYLTGNFVEPAVGTAQGTWTTKGTKSTITMYGTASTGTTTFTALIVPQNLATSDTLLTVETNDGTVYYKNSMNFEAGKNHTFEITVNNGAVTVLKTGTAITAWKPSGGGTGNIADESTQKAAEVGDLLHNDGTLAKTPISGKTPIAIVAYVANDVFSESGTGSGYGGHGLAICLKELGKYQYKNANSSTGLTLITSDALALTKDKEHVSGWYNTQQMIKVSNASTVYPAAYQAYNYTGLQPTPKAKTSGWFLASAGQWSKIIEGLSGYTPTFRSTVGGKLVDCVKIMNDKLATAGAGNYTPFTTTSEDHYWSSSPYSTSKAVRQCFHSNGFHFFEVNMTTSYRVRPVIAF